MHEFAHAGALDAMRAPVDRAVPGRLLTGPHPVLDLGSHRAADRAMRADALFNLDRYARLRRADRRGLPAGAELKSTGRRQPARRETGAAQAGSTIDRYWPERRPPTLNSCGTGVAAPPLGQHRPHPVLDLGSHRAADRAMRADALFNLDRYARLRRADRRGLPDGAELKSTGRRQPARRETGAAQEGSTIDRYWPDRRRQILKSCATGLAVPPLGQHRTLTCLVLDIRSRGRRFSRGPFPGSGI